MIIIEDILNNIKKVFDLKTDKEVADLLGLESSYLSKIRSRQSIPFKELFKLCEKEKIDISLLMYGKEIKINMNYKLKILNIIENANDKELEIYYHMLKAEELKMN